AQLSPMIANLALTPLLISRLGADRFGIWSLALIVLSTLTSLDGGLSASLARFFAVHAARDDRADAGRLLIGSLILFLGLGLLLTVVAYALAPTFVDLVHIPASLETEATALFRWLPLLTVVALAANATAALLQGNGRFREFALATATSVGVFAAAVVVLVEPGAHLRALIVAAVLRYATMAVCGLALARGHLALHRPLLPSWSTIREV